MLSISLSLWRVKVEGVGGVGLAGFDLLLTETYEQLCSSNSWMGKGIDDVE
jgi:hypothetical protein